MSLDAGRVMARLDAIEQDLELRQNDADEAATKAARAKRDYERQRVREFFKANASTVRERELRADLALVEQGYHQALEDAEASWEAHKAVLKVAELRVSIGQSLLKAMGRGA